MCSFKLVQIFWEKDGRVTYANLFYIQIYDVNQLVTKQ